MKNFKKLKIWQKGMELVALTYELAGKLPKEEQFGLKSQTTRAAVSIPSNIAEGSAKNSKKEYVQFLEYSMGSAFELETQVLIIDMLNYGDSELRKRLLLGIDEEQKMIQSFIQKVKIG
ncbi:MAG: four helix bundle protein [Cyclobacteriaceae bacterium]|nr:four helix bundle protein [Cyclobacteriaceae bacterium]UYN87808.1 MAG: four helix bundle protein [Cyclobacteriaceae bacterium]